MPRRVRAAGLIALSLLLGACSQAPVKWPAPKPVTVEAQLQQSLQPRLEKPAHLRVDARNVPQAMAEFYAARDWQPVWSDANFAVLLVELAKLGGDGLDPEDYGYSNLLQYQNVGNDPARQAEREKLATRAYLLALVHLYRGKVDPVRLDAHWNFDMRQIDPEKGLTWAREAVELNRIPEIFQRARPAFPQYDEARLALARLRAVAGAGGWPQFTAGPTLKPGMHDARVPVLRKRLALAGLLGGTAIRPSDLYDSHLAAAVQRFQRESYLDADGVLGPGTVEQLNIPVEQRIGQLRANLERMRWFLAPGKDDYVLVDITGYRIYYMHDNQPQWQARVQIGKAYRQTPIFKSEIEAVTLNPTWTVPPTIMKEDALPAIRRSRDYLARNHMRIFDATGHELKPESVDWNNPGRISLRQDAGPGNSLGQILVRFPNTSSVYIHDTPHQDLFSSRQRAFSSGCIRVENVHELAVLLLNDSQQWSRDALEAALATNKTHTINLNRKLPVLMTYWTVDVSPDGYVAFKPDVYGQDAMILSALDTSAAEARAN